MIFQYTYEKIQKGIKTRTSRIQKPGEELKRVPRGEWGIKTLAVVNYKGHIVYAVGQPRSIQPGRGQHGKGYIKILDICPSDVRKITLDEVKAEGFDTRLDFWLTWTQMHDKYDHMMLKGAKPENFEEGTWQRAEEWAAQYLSMVNSDHYQSWALTFKLEE